MIAGTHSRPLGRSSPRRVLPNLGLLVLLCTSACQGQAHPPKQMGEIFTHQPPGKLIDVGGFSLYLRCIGHGRPTVVIETGLGDHMDSWTEVQSAISRRTRVCVYDRAGSGFSGIDRHAPSLERMVRNVRVALGSAEIEGPYVLVGHGEGGLLVRRFVASYPDDVIALLLIDSSHENQISRMPKAMTGERASNVGPKRFCRIEAPMTVVHSLGLINAYLPIESPENLRPLRPEAIQETWYCATVRREAPFFRAAANQSEPPSRLGDIPLIVLTAGRGMNHDPLVSRTGLPAEVLAEWDALWLHLQAELASLSTNGDHRIVEDAGHFLQIDRPDAVIKGIEDLLSMARCCNFQDE